MRDFIFVKIFGRLRRPFFHSIFNVSPLYTTKNPIFFARFARNFEICLTFSLCIRPKIRFFSRVSRAILEFVHVFPLYMAKKPNFFARFARNFDFFQRLRQILVAGFYFSKSHPRGVLFFQNLIQILAGGFLPRGGG